VRSWTSLSPSQSSGSTSALAVDVNAPRHHHHTCSALPAAMSVAGGPDGLNDVYEALDSYNWDDDVEFQSGLSAILGSNSTPEQAAELTLRARCFYYAR
jgi:hypothetical protein